MKYIYIILFTLFSIQLYSQPKEKLYILFGIQGKEQCTTAILPTNPLEYIVTNGLDKIVITTKKNCRNSFFKKSKMAKHSDITNACALINLKYLDYTYRIENKKIYLLIEKGKKYEVLEIENITFIERPQD